MEIGRRLFSHSHHDHDGGGVIERPRLFEFVATAWFGGFRSRVFDALVTRTGAEQGDEVLDVGCGTGYFARRISHSTDNSARVVGIDPSASLVDYANDHAPPFCSFSVARAEHLPYRDNSFDLVVSSLAIHHIDSDQRPKAFSEMLRVLRPGGRLFIAEFRPPHSRFVNRLIGLFAGHAMQHQHAINIEQLAEAAGFHIDEHGEQRPFLHYTIADKPR